MTDDAIPHHPARIPPLPRAEWSEEARDIFAFWGEPDARRDGSRTNMTMVLANHPPLAKAYFTLGRHLLIDSTLPVRARELVVLRIAWRLKAGYEWHYHVGYAINAGLTPDEIRAVKGDPPGPGWSECDALVLRAVDELQRGGTLADGTWDALCRHFSRRQIMDLVFTIGIYVMTSWAIAAIGIQLEDGVDRIDFDLRTASGMRLAGRPRPGEATDWVASTGLADDALADGGPDGAA